MPPNVAFEISLKRLVDLLDSPSEIPNLDLKEALDPSEPRDRVELAKDVLAMANSGGGHIVVGVEDETRRRVGISETVSAVLRDAKTVNDKLKRYCGGFARVLVAQHEIEDPVSGSVRLALIYVPPARSKIPAQADGAYPDPDNPTKQKLAFRRGDVYIRKGDESVKVETPEDLQPAQVVPELGTEAAAEVVQGYLQRLTTTLSNALPPLPPCVVADEMRGQPLLELLSAPKDFLLLGPSGSGKSVHLKHLCVAAPRQNELPLLILGRRYRGEEFSRFLDREVGPFSAEDAKTLLSAALTRGFRIVLIIDGLNECEGHLEDLVKETQAFRLRYPSRLIMSSQTDAPYKEGPRCERVLMAPFTPAQKRFVFCYHAGIKTTTTVDYLCQNFANGYDLAVAGRCHDSGSLAFATAELYDRYCRKFMPSSGGTVLMALLRDVAGQMGQELRNFWPRDVLERHSEKFLSEQRAPLGLLDHLRSCRLVNITDDSFSFEHDLLFDYFRAEGLRRGYSDPDKLARELARPKNQSLIRFIVPRYAEAGALSTLLGAASHPAALQEVLMGHCGEAARRVLVTNCKQLYDAATDDLPNVTVALPGNTPEEATLSPVTLAVKGGRTWTRHELLLCDLIGTSLEDDELRRGFLDLLDITQWTLRAKAQEVASQSAVSFNKLWQVIVGKLDIFGGTDIPFLRITSSLRASMMGPPHQRKFPLRDQLLARVERDPKDHFSLGILLDGLHLGAPTAQDPDLYIGLARVGWESKMYSLRLKSLDLLRSMPWHLEKEYPEKVQVLVDTLQQFHTQDPFLSSTLAELLLRYGEIEPLASAEEASAEMRAIIAWQETLAGSSAVPDLCARAYGALGNIFEDVFQGAYYEAYEALSDDEKVELLCLAAQAENMGFATDWILAELLRYGGPSALPAFKKHASGVDAKSFMPQGAVEAFYLAIRGCARIMDEPPEYTGGHTPEHTAWQILGQILFWHFRSGGGPTSKLAQIDKLWDTLADRAPLAAADSLYRLRQGSWLSATGDAGGFDLVAKYPSQAKPLLEHSLKNHASLTSIFNFGGSRDEGVVRFVISALGRIGDVETIPLLREASDHPRFGADAIAAIRRIDDSTRDHRKAT